MSELQRITNKLFIWGQKLKAQELNDIISVINNIIDYININESYWLKDEVGNGDSNLIVPTYYEEDALIIARIGNKNGEIEYLYAPAKIEGITLGDKIRIGSIIYNEQNGTLLAELIINGQTYKICAPKLNNITADDIISINPIYNSGKEIAEVLNKNGLKVNSIYIPNTTITSLTPTLLNGVEIAKYKTAGDSQEKILLAPAPGSGGSTTSGVVELLAIYPSTGEPIAQFKLAGATGYTKIYAPKNTGGGSSGEGSSCSCTLSVDNLYDETTGVHVATIIFNGNEYPIYAPQGSGGGEDEPITYELYILYEEEYGFGKWLVIYKHQGNVTSQEERVTHTSGAEAMNSALDRYDFGKRIEFEEFFLERTDDGDFTFTIGGEPKFISCGTEIQHHSEDGDNHTYDYKLKPGTEPGQGYGNFDELIRYNFIAHDRSSWNSGLIVNQDDSYGVNSEGDVNNPPTKFEVYANEKQQNSNKGIYKIGEYSSVIEPQLDADVYGGLGNELFIRRAVKSFLKATIYDSIEGGNIIATYPLSLEEKKPNHMPREIVELPNHDGTPGTSYYYVSYTDCKVAPDNTLLLGFGILRAGKPGTPIRWTGTINDEDENGENSFVVTDSNGKNGRIRDRYALQDIANKYYREYLSDPEYFPYNNTGGRGLEKGFFRFPEGLVDGEYFFDTSYNNGNPVTRDNISPGISYISLNEGDYFIYFKKDDSTISTKVSISAFASTKGKKLSNGNWEFPDKVALRPSDYGWNIGEQWVFPAMGGLLMKALGNDNEWISFYGAVDAGEGTSVGGPNNNGGKNYDTLYFSTHFVDPAGLTNPSPDKMYEEWIYNSHTTEPFYRYGGNNYLIFAFRANKQLTLEQIG